MLFGTKYNAKKKENVDYFGRLKKVLREESWIQVILWMFWLAGPVTYLSLQAGSYAGYGKGAPTKTVIYFAIYTCVTAFFTILSRIFDQLFLTPRRQKKINLIEDTINRLFMLYFSARNQHLKNYNYEDRRIIAAWWYISSASIEDISLEHLVRQISNDDNLGLAIRRIEYYRSQGLYVLMNDEIEYYKERIDGFTEELKERFPALASYLQDRFKGIAPKLNRGHRRPVGFLQRLSEVLEDSDPNIATDDDMLSMLHLALEFLLGRSIFTVYPQFNGLERLEEAREEFDKNLSDFRLTIRRRNVKMMSLIIDLLEKEQLEQDSHFFTRGAKTKTLADFLLRSLAKIPRGDLKVRQRYEEIRRLNTQVEKLWYSVYSKERTYNRIWEKDSDKLKELFSGKKKINRKRSVLVFEENDIMLTDKQRYECALNILDIIDDIIIRRKNMTAVSVSDDSIEKLCIDDYKMIAAQIGNVFDEVLNISEPEEQLAIEASKSCDFGAVMPDQPLAIKLQNAKIAVNEITNNRSETAHKLASFLVQYLNVPLGEEIIDYLVSEYDASKDYLLDLKASDINNNKKLTAEMAKAELITLPNWGYSLQEFVNKMNTEN